MKCILHIGVHKTGTTAIQSALSRYDDGTTFYAQLGNPNHSVAIYTAFSAEFADFHVWKKQGIPESEIRTKREEALENLRQQLDMPSRERIIISGEDIGLLSNQEVGELTKFIRARCEDIVVLAYVRHPLAFAASAFQQRVQGGLASVPDLISAQYRYRLEKFMDILGKDKLIVKTYSPDSLVDGDVVKDFCATLNLDFDLTLTVRPNRSIGSKALKSLYLLNRTNPLQYGDDILVQCRTEFLRILDRVFDDDTKVDQTHFESVSDYSDCPWLKQAFNIDFAVIEQRDKPVETLVEWLDDFPDEATAQLIEFLKTNDINGAFARDPVKIINRIYYLTLEGGTLFPDGLKLRFRRLIEKDAEILRDIALRYENGTNVSRDEALFLMNLALRARPQGELMQEKIAEWSSAQTTVPQTSRLIREEDADILRHVALKYESGTELSRNEALSLMKLALRGRPQGQLIQQKIAEWGSAQHKASGGRYQRFIRLLLGRL